MKKIMAVLMSAVLIFLLTACGNVTPGDGAKENKSTAAENKAEDFGGKETKNDPVKAHINRIQANAENSFGLTKNGTIIAAAPDAVGSNVIEDLSAYREWNKIKNFASSSSAVAAVFEDGSVKMCGGLADEMQYGDFGEVSEWKDVVQVAVGKKNIVALKSDGTVKIAGLPLKEYPKDTDRYIQVEAGCGLIGVKSDGTVSVWDWSWSDPIDAVSEWKDIVSVSDTWNHIVALKSDGTVVACGNNDFGQCNVSDWSDIVAISAGMEFTVGLKSDGTVVFCGNNKDNSMDFGGWTDIVEIDAGFYHCVGLKSDGTVLSTGKNYSGQCSTDGWNLN